MKASEIIFGVMPGDNAILAGRGVKRKKTVTWKESANVTTPVIKAVCGHLLMSKSRYTFHCDGKVYELSLEEIEVEEV